MVTTPCRAGNRVESLDKATGRRMHLAYDAGNQLVQVRVQEESKHFTQRYRYDAFGRRLAKYNDPGNQGASEESGTDYFGWDGDRLVHTERLGSGNAKNDTDTLQPEVIHTVYEPRSFTPLVQLRRAAKAEPDLADELIAHMQPGIAQDALRGMFADIGATNALVNAGLGNLGMAVDAQDFIREQLKGFEETVNSQREENAKAVEVRHYLCDHLGTPNALVNDRGQIEWAAMVDAWGNVKAEHNPKELYQPIRLPGQHDDIATGIAYNRHRYYESKAGFYAKQDPIGLMGGINMYGYVAQNPNQWIDPKGLEKNNGNLQEFIEKISQCLCQISSSYCIKSNSIKAGETGFFGVWPQIIGIIPAGVTNILGNITISSDIYSNVPNDPNNMANGYLDLAQTIAHESLHQTKESWLRRMGREDPRIDEEASDFIQKNRQDIESCLKKKGCVLK